MPYRVPAALDLSEAERTELQRWARRRKAAQAPALRARVVLRAAAGLSNTAVAADLGVAEHTAGKWRERFARLRADGLLDEPRPGAPRRTDDERIAALPDRSQGPMASAPAMYPNLRYDPRRDLAPVHGIGASPHLIVAAPGRPWRSLAELVAAARARPDGLTYASVGVGTSPHLAAETLQRAAGVRMVHAPYANGTQGLNDVIGGRVDVMWDYPLTSLPHVREGRLRALAVTDARRVALAPEVPTVAEAGVPGAELVPWAGLFVPARTPPGAVSRLAAAMREAMGDPKVREFFDGTATVLWPGMGPEELRAFLHEELPRIAEIIARSGARAG
jgi:tripartite-type tricarboxylate transporter receptor subunit TctC